MNDPRPTHRLIQLSDLHLTERGTPLHGVLDCEAQLRAAFDRVAASALPVDAFLASGDLADGNTPDAYRRLRAIFDEQARRFGAPILIGAGNHDVRGPINRYLLDRATGDTEIDQVHVINGLRVINIDSSVPNAGHGELTATQLDWLAEVLRSPAAAGSILVIHHPPAPSATPLLTLVGLRNTAGLRQILTGSDVRLIVSGHWHIASHTTFAGIPLHIGGALAYAADPLAAGGIYRGMTKGQSFSMLEVFEDCILATSVPLASHPTLYETDTEQVLTALAGPDTGAGPHVAGHLR